MPSTEERLETDTLNGRMKSVRESIANLETQLDEAQAALDVTADQEKQAELTKAIADFEEALEHLEDELDELEALNTDALAATSEEATDNEQLAA